ncbi:ABC transporter permease [Acanthopleuribacter pedis]|uniref:ABC transporter permease n=1 Tax=Acanthopleuribacter pedis TaxID=442870 RepID=A0A8J7Q4D6_9BACT|nr:ABC transporter permease [Acanthopleuribacter pedis]MBO1317847.1 ABC transporter permease [Acanthopleuribacter pedis]
MRKPQFFEFGLPAVLFHRAKKVLRNLALKLGGISLILGSLLLAWHLIIFGFSPEPWLFPPPNDVWSRLGELWRSGVLQPHLTMTLTEILAGYAAGIGLSFLVGYTISQQPLLERLITPYLVVANSVPLVAFAPLLLLWLGNGITAKIVVTALIVFFPATISTINGFHAQTAMHQRMMRCLGAKKWQRFLFLELPSALPGIFAGMKIGAPLAVVGAVVGEFLGTGQGLGHLILEANGLMDTPQLFVTILVLGTVGVVFYSLIALAEQIFIGPWAEKNRR